MVIFSAIIHDSPQKHCKIGSTRTHKTDKHTYIQRTVRVMDPDCVITGHKEIREKLKVTLVLAVVGSVALESWQCVSI